MNDNVKKVAVLINANGVRVVEYLIGPRSSGSWHYHTTVSEFCYCLAGMLSVEVEGEKAELINPGERCSIDTKVIHRVSNNGQTPCRFLIVQGVGVYDFVLPEKPL